MSVSPGDRGVSTMQFTETADRIEERAMQICRKWPKAYMFIITARTIELASAIYEHAENANSIFPITSEEERTERLLELHRALAANINFSRKIERAFHMFPLCGDNQKLSDEKKEAKSGAILEELMALCATEEEALKGNITFTRNYKIQQRPR